MCRIIDSRSSLIPICLILTSGASLRASLKSVRKEPRSLVREVIRAIVYLSLTSVFPPAAIDDDDFVVVETLLSVSLLVDGSARAQPK